MGHLHDRPPGRAAAPAWGTGADGQTMRGGTITIQPISLVARVEDAVDAGLVAIAALLGGEYDRHDPRRVDFRCPLCQRGGARRASYGPAAQVVDELRWRCIGCDHEGTVWELRRIVLEDPAALDLIVETLGGQL